MVSDNVLPLIRVKYNTFSSSQKVVADYVLEHAKDVMMNTLNELASACQVSETTVLRFLHKINFSSYQLFRIKLTQELSKDSPHAVYQEVDFQDDTQAVKNKIIDSTINSLRDSREIIDAQSVDRFADLILGAGRILIIGVGASAFIAMDMFHKFTRLGLNVICSHDPHISNILATNLTDKDILITISHSGESREILDALALARDNKCQVAAVTSYLKSTLANEADCVLCSSSLETSFRSDAMTSRIIQLVIIDIVFVTLVTRLGAKILPQIYKTKVAVAKNKT